MGISFNLKAGHFIFIWQDNNNSPAPQNIDQIYLRLPTMTSNKEAAL